MNPASDREGAASPPAGRVSGEHALLREVWQISHYGWIPEAAIRRGLALAHGQTVPAAVLHERLDALQAHGWIEQRQTAAEAGVWEWRLTDRGRTRVR